MSTRRKEEEPPEWFESSPEWLKQLILDVGGTPESWRAYVDPNVPSWVREFEFARGFGYLSPVGLGPSYGLGMIETAGRAGWITDLVPEGYTYESRQEAAEATAQSYLTPTRGTITDEHRYLHAVAQSDLWMARAAYWQRSQEMAPLAEVWSAVRLSTYMIPRMGLVRALGFPFYGALRQLATGFEQAPYIRAAYAAEPTWTIQTLKTSPMFSAFQPQGLMEWGIQSVGQWTIAQSVYWGLSGGLGTLRGMMGVNIMQPGLDLLVNAVAVEAAWGAAGIPTPSDIRTQNIQNAILGGTLTLGGLAYQGLFGGTPSGYPEIYAPMVRTGNEIRFGSLARVIRSRMDAYGAAYDEYSYMMNLIPVNQRLGLTPLGRGATLGAGIGGFLLGGLVGGWVGEQVGNALRDPRPPLFFPGVGNVGPFGRGTGWQGLTSTQVDLIRDVGATIGAYGGGLLAQNAVERLILSRGASAFAAYGSTAAMPALPALLNMAGLASFAPSILQQYESRQLLNEAIAAGYYTPTGPYSEMGAFGLTSYYHTVEFDISQPGALAGIAQLPLGPEAAASWSPHWGTSTVLPEMSTALPQWGTESAPIWERNVILRNIRSPNYEDYEALFKRRTEQFQQARQGYLGILSGYGYTERTYATGWQPMLTYGVAIGATVQDLRSMLQAPTVRRVGNEWYNQMITRSSGFLELDILSSLMDTAKRNYYGAMSDVNTYLAQFAPYPTLIKSDIEYRGTAPGLSYTIEFERYGGPGGQWSSQKATFAGYDLRSQLTGDVRNLLSGLVGGTQGVGGISELLSRYGITDPTAVARFSSSIGAESAYAYARAMQAGYVPEVPGYVTPSYMNYAYQRTLGPPGANLMFGGGVYTTSMYAAFSGFWQKYGGAQLSYMGETYTMQNGQWVSVTNPQKVLSPSEIPFLGGFTTTPSGVIAAQQFGVSVGHLEVGNLLDPTGNALLRGVSLSTAYEIGGGRGLGGYTGMPQGTTIDVFGIKYHELFRNGFGTGKWVDANNMPMPSTYAGFVPGLADRKEWATGGGGPRPTGAIGEVRVGDWMRWQNKEGLVWDPGYGDYVTPSAFGNTRPNETGRGAPVDEDAPSGPVGSPESSSDVMGVRDKDPFEYGQGPKTVHDSAPFLGSLVRHVRSRAASPLTVRQVQVIVYQTLRDARDTGVVAAGPSILSDEDAERFVRKLWPKLSEELRNRRLAV